MRPDEQPGVGMPIDPVVAAAGVGPSRGRRATLDVLAAVAAGGALGAPARYEVSRLVHVARDTFPWATFWTNVTGSVVLGFVLVLMIERFPPARYARPFFAVGFLGAYTTMSTFLVETALLIKDGRAPIAAMYVVSSMCAGLGAVWAGIVVGRAVPPRTRRRADR